MMVVSLMKVPPRLRGYLTKYLWEINTGVYVGNVNVRIREAIWLKIVDNVGEAGRAIMVFPSDNEQGFDFYTSGSAWQPVDYEGLKLIIRPNERKRDTGIAINKRLPASILKAGDNYIVLDLETTGLDVEKDKILEIGALRIERQKVTENFCRIISVPVPENISRLTGITQEMADNGCDISNALIELGKFINGWTVIGYHIRLFDAKILNKECKRNGINFPLRKVIDVMDIVTKVFPHLPSHRLRNIANAIGITADDKQHRALIDCRLCHRVYTQCIGENAIST